MGAHGNTLANYTAPSGNGTYTNFLNTHIDLSGYLDQSNIRIRFNYLGNGSTTSAWGIDNVSIGPTSGS